MKSLSKITILAIGCGVIPLVSQSLGSEDASGKVIIVDDSELGNWDRPVILDSKDIKNYSQLEEALQEYVRKNHEGYEVLGRMFTMDEDGHFILIFSLKNEEGKQEILYFDMTDVYKNLSKSKDEKTRNKIKEMEEKHTPLSESKFFNLVLSQLLDLFSSDHWIRRLIFQQS
ncbi:hypothetical protein [Akkermansia sp.]|uniref:hypothetical protein n=1 Tax=Akkermansia sp. TaxID=1872421 RepID=UPI0025BDDE6D|nr:hypothetical protein [Akkermansia sp.]MCC8147436.1 hypothetical protein [Akkermansia sp.]